MHSKMLCFVLTMVAMAATAPAMAQDLRIDDNFVMVNPDCSASTVVNPCTENLNPDPSVPKLIHTVSLSAGFSEAGDGFCIVEAGIVPPNGNLVAARTILQVFAKSLTPSVSAITLPEPIRIPAGYQLGVTGSMIGDGIGDGTCRVDAFFGVELLKK